MEVGDFTLFGNLLYLCFGDETELLFTNRASYSDGKLVSPRPGISADPKPTAGNNGTQITVSLDDMKAKFTIWTVAF